jgi:hypothetical protein
VALLAFLIPTTLVAHAFWQVAGTASFTVQLLNFLKNTAMAGGLLFIGGGISANHVSANFEVRRSRTSQKWERCTPFRKAI